MKATEKIANRLALLAGVDLSEAELESIAAELEDLDRIVEELEDFAQGTPWVSHQSQPGGSKA
jgi:Asp-tRNA(Asn)/Glu-tRNA(Gln) amidotransferase C subunit